MAGGCGWGVQYSIGGHRIAAMNIIPYIHTVYFSNSNARKIIFRLQEEGRPYQQQQQQQQLLSQ